MVLYYDEEREAAETLATRMTSSVQVKQTRFDVAMDSIREAGALIDDAEATINRAADRLAGLNGNKAQDPNERATLQPVADCTIERLEELANAMQKKAQNVYQAAQRFQEQGII